MTNTKVLICEDESIVGLELENRVQSFGYNVMGVYARGTDAIMAAKENRPDVALVDMRLDGTLTGADVAQVLREDLDVPSVFLTAYHDNETMTKIKNSGGVGYLVKPVLDPQLNGALQVAIAQDKRPKWFENLDNGALLVPNTRMRDVQQLLLIVCRQLSNSIVPIEFGLDWLSTAIANQDYEKRQLSVASKGLGELCEIIERVRWAASEGMLDYSFFNLNDTLLAARQALGPRFAEVCDILITPGSGSLFIFGHALPTQAAFMSVITVLSRLLVDSRNTITVDYDVERSGFAGNAGSARRSSRIVNIRFQGRGKCRSDIDRHSLMMSDDSGSMRILGMMVAAAVVEKQGGSISFNSTVDMDPCITLTLPLADAVPVPESHSFAASTLQEQTHGMAANGGSSAAETSRNQVREVRDTLDPRKFGWL